MKAPHEQQPEEETTPENVTPKSHKTTYRTFAWGFIGLSIFTFILGVLQQRNATQDSTPVPLSTALFLAIIGIALLLTVKQMDD